MRTLFAVFAMLAAVFGCSALEISRLESATLQLDRAIKERRNYIALRQRQIDSVQAQLGRHDLYKPALYMSMANLYKSFNNDSSMAYLRRGIAATTGTDSYPFRFRYAEQLPLCGLFDTAHSIFYGIPRDSVPPEMLADYLDAGRQMHSYMAAFFGDYPEVAEPHKDQALAFQKEMLDVLSHDSKLYKFNRAEYAFLTGELSYARVLLEEIVDSEHPASNIRARAAHHLSKIARDNNDVEAYRYYLTLSALADVLSATRELVSLQDLGALAYEQGDVRRAYGYLSDALENAVECGAPLRMVNTAKVLPLIESSYSNEISESRRDTVMVIIGLAVLMVILIVILLVLRHEILKMQRLQHKLAAANTAKEVYISQFLLLCSIYMDKLNQFCKIVTRKLSAGQSEELYRMTKSGKFVEEQSREFYEVFDNAFLHIYPDFVLRVNELLRPDAQLEIPPQGSLSTDFRILAFMRLGIEESQRIAQVLNYSLNTIYSYRNRLKARAIDRDNFEAQLMKIDSVV